MNKWKWLAAMAMAATLLALLASGPLADAASTEKTQRKAGETVDAAVNYAQETKAELISEMQARLQSIQTNIDELRRQAVVASSEKKEALQKRLSAQAIDLESKRARLNTQLDRFQNSAGDAWKRLKAGLGSAWNDASRALRDARAELDRTGDRNDARE